jgi:putative permease
MQANIKRERRLKLTAFTMLLVLGLVILLSVDNMLVSFIIAFVLNYLLSPIVSFLERLHVRRQFAIVIPFFSAALLLAFGVYKIFPLITQQTLALESSLPQYQQDLSNLIASTEQRFKLFFSFYKINVGEELNAWILRKSTALSLALPNILSHSVTVFFLAPLFAFFMLQDGRRILRALLKIVPNNYFELTLHLQHKINEQMGGFIRARLLESTIVGAVVWLGLQLAGFPYATLLSLFAAVTNLIPYIGPIIGAIPAVLIALISDGAMIAHPMSLNLLLVIGVYFLAQLIDIVFIIPFLVARIVNLHPVTVIIVISIGAQLMGILGMIISIPVASALKLILSTIYSHLMEAES